MRPRSFQFLFALLSVWLTVASTFSVLHAHLALEDIEPSWTISRRDETLCRSKCSSASCSHAPAEGPSDNGDADLDARALDRRTFFPANYNGNLDQSIVSRFTSSLNYIFPPVAGSDDTTSLFMRIGGRKAFDMGLQALCGCTALIVVSQNGIYGAHFFEAVAWGMGDAAFQKYVINHLRDQSKGLTASVNALSQNGVDVYAYILTPKRSRINNAVVSLTDAPHYQAQVRKLVQEVQSIMPQLVGNTEVRTYQALEGGQNTDGTDINPQDAYLLGNCHGLYRRSERVTRR